MTQWIEKGPVPRPDGWLAYVNAAQTSAEVEAIGKCITRGTPYGSETWVKKTAKAHGLESTLSPRGRPRKVLAEAEEGK